MQRKSASWLPHTTRTPYALLLKKWRKLASHPKIRLSVSVNCWECAITSRCHLVRQQAIIEQWNTKWKFLSSIGDDQYGALAYFGRVSNVPNWPFWSQEAQFESNKFSMKSYFFSFSLRSSWIFGIQIHPIRASSRSSTIFISTSSREQGCIKENPKGKAFAPIWDLATPFHWSAILQTKWQICANINAATLTPRPV